MASYGIVRALLGLGIEVDLVVPTQEEVYFPLREEGDADSLPVAPLEETREEQRPSPLNGRKLVKAMDTAFGAYSIRSEEESAEEDEIISQAVGVADPLSFVLQFMVDPHALVKDVRTFTLRAIKLSSLRGYDLIHAHDWLTYPAAILLKRLSGKPLVAHVHSTELDRAGGPGDNRIHRIEHMGTQLADRVIVVSAYTGNIVAETYKVDRNKLRVVHNAFTLEFGGREKERIFKEPTIVFVGRITLQKGPDYFLEVARRVQKEEKNVRFIMAGRGDMERVILHKAASFGLGTKFLFAGFLTREELEPILCAADIFVMPSVSEPFGIVALEAMSCGAVAIIAKQSGVAEAIDNAFKIDFWDIDQIVSVILHLVRNPQELEDISQRGVEEVGKLQWEEAGRKIIGVYEELKRT
jgi:glycosyltransferase involved in cell wall biosynthesis